MMEALSNLTLGEIAGWVAIGLVALSSVVEISPIKINPWSWLGKQIGKVARIADFTRIVDNSAEEPVLICEVKGKAVQVYDNKIWDKSEITDVPL